MAPHIAAGVEVGGYQIHELLGRGGMGFVYRATHPRLRSDVALKLLSPDLAEDEAFRDRFMLESQLASALNHPNIVPVYDAGEADGQLYLAMRLVNGPSLKAMIADESPLDAGRTLALLSQAASALDAAHTHGLVHRDVKPENILVTSGGATEFGEHAYLTDFGVSKHLASGTGLTRTGQLVGTLNYVAPEQIEGRPIDARCDQYALGCVLYESLTGSAPFERESDAPLLYAHLNEPPPRVTAKRPELTSGIDMVVARMMAKNPSDRYASCGQALASARASLAAAGPAPRPRRRPRVRLRASAVLAGVGLVAGAGGIALLLTNPSPSRSTVGRPAGATSTTSAGRSVPLVLPRLPLASPDRRTPQPTTRTPSTPPKTTPTTKAPPTKKPPTRTIPETTPLPDIPPIPP